jgi:two-component system chemotaxis sensor kinase CheA
VPDDDSRADDGWDRHLTVWLGDAGGAAALDADAIEQVVRGAGDVADCHVTREVNGTVHPKETGAAQTVRIPVERLDDLLDVVGELVLVRDRLQRQLRPTANAGGRQALDDASKLIVQLRDAILRSRMVPLAQVFDRFPRHVRDTAQALGKDIDLVLEGRELEVDRSLLDELSDPLLHLLRNAIDHGLEPPGERLAAGKPERGRLVVRAMRDGAMVAVSVADDGRGVDRAKVAVQARAQGVANAVALAEDDRGLLQLLARPGLSTAETVTTLSGRGVGVDAVQSRVQALGGRLELATAVDTGTVITIRLPLSIAMLRTLLVRVADETYAIPLAHVRSTHRLESCPRLASGAVDVAGEPLRLVSLRTHLGLSPKDDVSGHVVVIDCAGERVALRVDTCLSQHEIVVKPLQRVRGSASTFSGGTILPDGIPSLILDINSLS